MALLQGISSSTSQVHKINHLKIHIANDSGVICTIPKSPRHTNVILDTGATDHQSFFQCIKRINPIIIKFPNGSLVTTTYVSTIHFDKQLYVTDVLYMLDFSFNLFFVPKLTKSLKCRLMFNDNGCMVHDTQSNKMIGTTRLYIGLYTLDSPSFTLYHTPFTYSINTLHDHTCNR